MSHVLLLVQGTALALPLKDASVHTVCTSPPYFALRSYGIGAEHGELGMETSPDAYVAAMVQVFREVKRVLRDDGLLFLNMGDSYAHTGQSGPQGKTGQRATRTFTAEGLNGYAGIPAKNLLGMPWRVAFALQADGWILRSDIIWEKPSCMPSSVQDRPTRSHEYIFLFSKQARYFYDAEAVKEATDMAYLLRRNPHGRAQNATAKNTMPGQGIKNNTSFNAAVTQALPYRNARTVWRIASESTSFAHFATFPTALVRRCLLAGAPTQVCRQCGAPWKREVERQGTGWNGSLYGERAVAASGGAITGGTARSTLGSSHGALVGTQLTTGFSPTCDCLAGTQPATVLDPFCGSGTTLLVARELGHRAVGVDLSWNYLSTIARERLGLTALKAWQEGAAPRHDRYDDLPLFAP